MGGKNAGGRTFRVDMTDRIFKIVAASITLLLYLSTMVASDVVALTCHCMVYHNGENQIAHTHSLHHAACCSNHFSHHHLECDDYDCCDSKSEHNAISISLQSDDCNCGHDHSNNIELYTQPRSADDETELRYVAAAVVINDIGSCLKKSHDSKNSDAYGVYLLPPLSAAYSSSSSLRAPPSLV